LSWEAIKSILKEEKVDESLYDNPEKVRFWHLNGMTPRSLEYAINTVKDKKFSFSQENEELENLYEKIENNVEKVYKSVDIPNAYLEHLKYCSLTGAPIGKDSFFTNLFEISLLYLENVRIILPLFYFKKILQSTELFITTEILIGAIYFKNNLKHLFKLF
jgi:hypothetical protein